MYLKLSRGCVSWTRVLQIGQLLLLWRCFTMHDLQTERDTKNNDCILSVSQPSHSCNFKDMHNLQCTCIDRSSIFREIILMIKVWITTTCGKLHKPKRLGCAIDLWLCYLPWTPIIQELIKSSL